MLAIIEKSWNTLTFLVHFFSSSKSRFFFLHLIFLDKDMLVFLLKVLTGLWNKILQTNGFIKMSKFLHKLIFVINKVVKICHTTNFYPNIGYNIELLMWPLPSMVWKGLIKNIKTKLEVARWKWKGLFFFVYSTSLWKRLYYHFKNCHWLTAFCLQH